MIPHGEVSGGKTGMKRDWTGTLWGARMRGWEWGWSKLVRGVTGELGRVHGWKCCVGG